MNLDNKTVVHCPTEELANKVLQKAHNEGYKWGSGASFLKYNNWITYGKDTCYFLIEGQYSDIKYYKEKRNKIISAEEYLGEEKVDLINDEFIVDCRNNSTEERHEVYKFLVEKRNYSDYYLSYKSSIIVCNKKQGDSNYNNLIHFAKTKYPNYPILTFEQFKQKYLMEDKEIIGYKLIKPEYEKIALKALGLQSAHEPFIIAGMIGYYIPKIKELGIIDWFEPIYEEEFKLPIINKYEGRIEDNNVVYGCAVLPIEWFKESSSRCIKFMELSSGVMIYEKDMEAIRKYLKHKNLI